MQAMLVVTTICQIINRREAANYRDCSGKKICSANLRKIHTQVAVRRCSSKWIFLKMSQYSQENSCVGVFFLMKFIRGSRTGFFRENYAKCLRTAIFFVKKQLWWLLLYIRK